MDANTYEYVEIRQIFKCFKIHKIHNRVLVDFSDTLTTYAFWLKPFKLKPSLYLCQFLGLSFAIIQTKPRLKASDTAAQRDGGL